MPYTRESPASRSYSSAATATATEPPPTPRARQIPEPRPILTELRRGDLGSEIRPQRLEQREEWTWESWGHRSEGYMKRVAQNLEMINWAAIGALTGAGLAAIPALYLGVSAYPLYLAQPSSAALGAVVGNLLAWWRWRRK